MIRRIFSATLMSLSLALFGLAALTQIAVADDVTDPVTTAPDPVDPDPQVPVPVNPPKVACNIVNLVPKPPVPGPTGPIVGCTGNLCPNGQPGNCQWVALPTIPDPVTKLPITVRVCDCPAPRKPQPVPIVPQPDPQPVTPVIISA